MVITKIPNFKVTLGAVLSPIAAASLIVPPFEPRNMAWHDMLKIVIFLIYNINGISTEHQWDTQDVVLQCFLMIFILLFQNKNLKLHFDIFNYGQFETIRCLLFKRRCGQGKTSRKIHVKPDSETVHLGSAVDLKTKCVLEK